MKPPIETNTAMSMIRGRKRSLALICKYSGFFSGSVAEDAGVEGDPLKRSMIAMFARCRTVEIAAIFCWEGEGTVRVAPTHGDGPPYVLHTPPPII